jgi:hypothetical protein
MALSVIGAGYGRTGTMSLKLALERLGFGPCYHMIEVIKDPAVRSPAWEAAADGQDVDWEAVFDGFKSCVDWPGATFYRRLAEAYPNAKIILTVRDPESWYRSTQATIFSLPMPEDAEDPWGRMVGKVIGRLFDHRMHDHDRLIAEFNRHNDQVRQTIPAERLLVYDAAEGWGPLCAFLGVNLPEGPMPKANTTEEFRERLASKLQEHLGEQASREGPLA